MIRILPKFVRYSIDPIDKFLKGNKQLIINFVSLSAVQVTNFILPLLVYPYLYKITGSRNFGSIIYALNIFLYLSTVIDYGFSTSAPKDLSVHKEKGNLSRKISTIIQTKLLLLLMCSSFLIIFIYFSDLSPLDKKLYLYGLVMLAGNSLLPTWLYQGMEEMKHLTWINLFAKLLSIALVFLNIENQEDYVLSLSWIGSANLLSGLIGIFYAYRRFELKVIWIGINEIIDELKSGWYYFISCFSAVLYGNSTVIILGFYVSNTSLGNYGIAEKIAFSLWQIITVFSQVTFPVMCRLNLESRNKLNTFVRTYHYLFTCVVAVLCALLFILAHQIIKLAIGIESQEATNILRILTLFPLLVVLNVPANQLITINEKQKYIAYVINIFGMFSLISCFLFTKNYGTTGAACTAVVSQLFLTFSLYYILKTRIPKGIFWNKE